MTRTVTGKWRKSRTKKGYEQRTVVTYELKDNMWKRKGDVITEYREIKNKNKTTKDMTSTRNNEALTIDGYEFYISIGDKAVQIYANNDYEKLGINKGDKFGYSTGTNQEAIKSAINSTRRMLLNLIQNPPKKKADFQTPDEEYQKYLDAPQDELNDYLQRASMNPQNTDWIINRFNTLSEHTKSLFWEQAPYWLKELILANAPQEGTSEEGHFDTGITDITEIFPINRTILTEGYLYGVPDTGVFNEEPTESRAITEQLSGSTELLQRYTDYLDYIEEINAKRLSKIEAQIKSMETSALSNLTDEQLEDIKKKAAELTGQIERLDYEEWLNSEIQEAVNRTGEPVTQYGSEIAQAQLEEEVSEAIESGIQRAIQGGLYGWDIANSLLLPQSLIFNTIQPTVHDYSGNVVSEGFGTLGSAWTIRMATLGSVQIGEEALKELIEEAIRDTEQETEYQTRDYEEPTTQFNYEEEFRNLESWANAHKHITGDWRPALEPYPSGRQWYISHYKTLKSYLKKKGALN
jgi:hypothetical protein